MQVRRIHCPLSFLDPRGWSYKVDALLVGCFLHTAGISLHKEAAQSLGSSYISSSENCLQLPRWILDYVVQVSLTMTMEMGIDIWPKV